jgi:uncharacterized OB-fold protein
MSEFPAPERTPLNEPFWQGLAEGSLRYQRCNACGHAWLPPREECPQCLRADWAWTPASGQAKLVAWVVYHTAFHPWFKERLPYNVALVELVEGPRMITNIVRTAVLRADMPLRLVIEAEAGTSLARFTGLDGR